MLRGRTIESVRHMDVLGYATSLCEEDVEWLLADGPTGEAENERRLAVNAALDVWRGVGSPPVLLERIEKRRGRMPL